MRRIFITLFSIAVMIILPANAAQWTAADRVSYIGTIIVKKNSLPGDIQFKAVSGVPDNRYAIAANSVQINSEDLLYANNDSEVAYLIASELGGIIVKNINTKNKFYSSEEIDAMGLDLMINSGYNPLAGIAVLVKMSNSGRTIDIDKAQFIYDYLLYNYPSKLRAGYSNNEYETFAKNFQPVLQERNSSKRKLKHFYKSQAKICANRVKSITKYNAQVSKLSEWNLTTELLLSITEPEEVDK